MMPDIKVLTNKLRSLIGGLCLSTISIVMYVKVDAGVKLELVVVQMEEFGIE